jgi:putative ABC transport system substrate-binding protein
MTSRRKVLGTLGVSLLVPRFALAQSPRRAVVVLFAGEEEDDGPATQPFFEEMRRLGWVEGTNIDYERFFGRGTREYMEGLAKSAADLTPDLVYATTAATAMAVVKASDSVPVIFNAASDPVASGLVNSLARPGKNATGVFQPALDGVQRRMQFARQALPGLKRMGLVIDRRSNEYQRQRAMHEEAARAIGIELSTAEFVNFEAVAKHLANFRRDGITAAALTPSVTLLGRRRDVAEAALRNRISLIGHRLEWAEAGALLSYGPDVSQALRRSARMADRVLRGAKPAETPVEQASRLELIVNSRTAKLLNVALSQGLLKSADRVIE